MVLYSSTVPSAAAGSALLVAPALLLAGSCNIKAHHNCGQRNFLVAHTPCRHPASTKCKGGRSVQALVEAAESPVSTVKLGGSELKVSKIGIGTIQWGDTTKGYGSIFDEEDLYSTFEAARVGGVNLFDTAEVYGYQSIKEGAQSEQLVGKFAQIAATLPLDGPPPVLASKFFPVPWTNLLVGGGVRLGRGAMLDALRASLARLGVEQLDLWQVHFPLPTYPQKVLATGLQEAVDLGLVRAVGVCNYDGGQVTQMHELLKAHGIPLASNQVKYNVLDRSVEQNGTLARCRELDVALIAHSPLQQGLLSGRSLHVTESATQDEKEVRPLLNLLQLIGSLSGGRTVTQVALNWLIAKGAIPIPGAKTAQQSKEHVGALGWSLDENEVAMVEEKLEAMKL